MHSQAEAGDKAYRVATVHTAILPLNTLAPPVLSESTVVGMVVSPCVPVGVSAVRERVEGAAHALDPSVFNILRRAVGRHFGTTARLSNEDGLPRLGFGQCDGVGHGLGMVGLGLGVSQVVVFDGLAYTVPSERVVVPAHRLTDDILPAGSDPLGDEPVEDGKLLVVEPGTH